MAYDQLYNNIITAHAIIMSAPLCLADRLVGEKPNESNCVKGYNGGFFFVYLDLYLGNEFIHLG